MKLKVVVIREEKDGQVVAKPEDSEISVRVTTLADLERKLKGKFGILSLRGGPNGEIRSWSFNKIARDGALVNTWVHWPDDVPAIAKLADMGHLQVLARMGILRPEDTTVPMGKGSA